MDASKTAGSLAPIAIVLVLIVAAVYVYSTSGSHQGTQIIPGSNNSAERASLAQANGAAIAAHESNVFGGFGQLVGLATTEYNNATSITLGEQTVQDKANGYNAAVAQATLQERAIEAQANAQRDIQQTQAHAAQQTSFWNGLFGAAAAAFGL